jgi:hypothetical protein
MYGKVNLMFSDGEYLFIHTNLKRSMYMYKGSDFTCFSTEPIKQSLSRSEWVSVPMNRLLVYKDGMEIHIGEEHTYEYSRPIHDYRSVCLK